MKLGSRVLLTMPLVVAPPALADPSEVGQPPCFYREEDVRRMDFMAAYTAAHQAQLAPSCVVDNPTIERLQAELDAVSDRAQARNPDVDLSTFEGTAGYGVCRIPPGDRDGMCEKSDDVASTNFALAMANLRNFTKKWR